MHEPISQALHAWSFFIHKRMDNMSPALIFLKEIKADDVLSAYLESDRILVARKLKGLFFGLKIHFQPIFT